MSERSMSVFPQTRKRFLKANEIFIRWHHVPPHTRFYTEHVTSTRSAPTTEGVWPSFRETKPPLFNVGIEQPTFAFVESFVGDRVRCRAEIAGSWLPVEFPANFLRDKNLAEGDRFIWWVAEDGSVLPQHIDADVSRVPTLSDDEEAERRRLHDEFLRSLPHTTDRGYSEPQGT